MDGDIKRHSPKQKTRAKQKSSTLARKSVTAKHRSSTPLGTALRSKAGTDNPFTPPAVFGSSMRIRYMLIFGSLAMLFFGISMFFLGASFSGNNETMVDETSVGGVVRRPATGDTPRCEVVWQQDSPITAPGFVLEFDRELPLGFRPLFVANNRAITATDGVYTLQAETPTEYDITVVQDSDVVTDEILCQYGPVLIGNATTATDATI